MTIRTLEIHFSTVCFNFMRVIINKSGKETTTCMQNVNGISHISASFHGYQGIFYCLLKRQNQEGFYSESASSFTAQLSISTRTTHIMSTPEFPLKVIGLHWRAYKEQWLVAGGFQPSWSTPGLIAFPARAGGFPCQQAIRSCWYQQVKLGGDGEIMMKSTFYWNNWMSKRT